MSREEHTQIGVNIGSASILMVFAVLCLTIFSVLAFVTANQEMQLAKKSAAAVEHFYVADVAAEETYQAVAEVLQENDVIASLEMMGCTVVVKGNELQIGYRESVDESQELAVVLETADNRKTLRVRQWQVVPVGEWTIDESIDVWTGSELE